MIDLHAITVVHDIESALEQQHGLDLGSGTKLSPTSDVTIIMTQLLGIIEAGWPSPAEEALLDIISLDEYLIPDKEASYILRVNGDSMIDAGIHPGDMVIVERTPRPRDREIVIAEVDGEWTMKFFRQQGQKVWLEAANVHYPPIQPQRELTIIAVVRAVVRKYNR